MDKTTELFCLIDESCQQFEPLLERRLLDEGSDQRRRNRECAMTLSEMNHDCGAVSHDARAAFQRVLPRHRPPLHDCGISPPAVIYPLRGLDAALRGGAGGFVRDAQGRLHRVVHCRRYAARADSP